MKKKKSVADNIRILRDSLGYSQEYMANTLGITQQAYSQIEKDPEKATLKRLREISSILQVELVILLGEDDHYVLQNFNQSGGQAATQMTVIPSNNEISAYTRLADELKEEIVFLRKLVEMK
jgi:transcriptional regulator with XRE-family HTH domain